MRAPLRCLVIWLCCFALAPPVLGDGVGVQPRGRVGLRRFAPADPRSGLRQAPREQTAGVSDSQSAEPTDIAAQHETLAAMPEAEVALFAEPSETSAASPSTNQSSSTENNPKRRDDSSRNANQNSQQVSAGREAFNRDCTSCHEAERALSRRKSASAWRNTIRRMAGKAGANIPSGDVDSIAAYLASQGSSGSGEQASGSENDKDAKGQTEQGEGPSLSAFGVFSPYWRGGNDNLQNPGFFPETWVGAAWQPSDGLLSARATACISCHNEPALVSRVEIVEAALRLDLAKSFHLQHPDVRATVDAGRFIVPFGAFSAQSSPGVFRTVTKPLIFNMGQRVASTDLGEPVLPMPSSDEGANFNLSLPVTCYTNATMDVYLVNGLQGTSSGLDYTQSRDYVDNNARPATGGRVTFGGKNLRLGGSITGGQFNSTANARVNQPLNYQIFGFDISAHYEDIVRVQAEYAQRDSDRIAVFSFPLGSGIHSLIFPQPTPVAVTDRLGGYYVEGELRVYDQPRMSLLARYDGQDRHALLPPPGSTLSSGTFGVRRFTYGVNFTLARGSLLMINHEHWWLPDGLPNVDVIGVRWAAVF